MKQISDLVKRIPVRNTPIKNETQPRKELPVESDRSAPIDPLVNTPALSPVEKEEEKEFSPNFSLEEEVDTAKLDDGPGWKEGGILTAVRIRPLNAPEVINNSRIVVSNPEFMSQGLQIINPIFFKSSTQTDKLRKLEERGFSFDYTFWSLAPGSGVDQDEYASQRDIYYKIGKPIIQNALTGFNSSLFAYGQTGSGKTYTMMGPTMTDQEPGDSDDDSDPGEKSDTRGGDEDQAGIIPRLCQGLLDEVTRLQREAVALFSAGSTVTHPSSSSSSSSSSSTERVVEIHMRAAYYEIYNEKLFDLLSNDSDCEVPRKVREHATEGAYVEGLQYCPIASYPDIEAILRTGQDKRKTAETKMNAESSRSHAIFVILIEQKIELLTPPQSSKNTGAAAKTTTQTVERKSKISLVDLAGSERLNATGATGDRLKEATNINSSLSTLGEVIRKLSDQGKSTRRSSSSSSSSSSSGSNDDGDALYGSNGRAVGSNVHVPYRNSLLTWILKDSLGGNSKTAIVATVSPSEASYAESLNTLRYLERAKHVETNAVINENKSQDPYVKHLQHQLSAYKAKLNLALTQIRQQEREHKCALTELTEELDLWRSRNPHTPQSALDTSIDSDTGPSLLRQLSSEDLAVTLGSEVDLMELLGSSCGGGTDGERAISPVTSIKRTMTQSGRTMEYFENECYDLQESLARSMEECNGLRERLTEVEDIHTIELDILNEELQSLSAERDGGGEKHKEFGVLQATVERLQMRLHEKDLDLLAVKTRAQADQEANNKRLLTLEDECSRVRDVISVHRSELRKHQAEQEKEGKEGELFVEEKESACEGQSVAEGEHTLCDSITVDLLEESNVLLEGYRVAMRRLEERLQGHEEKCQARVLAAEEEGARGFNEKVDMLMRLVKIAESAQEKAEGEVASSDSALAEGAIREADLQSQVRDLQARVMRTEQAVSEWEGKEAEWMQSEENYAKVIHSLTDEIEVLEMDILTKNACLELFESQLVTQENELKAAQSKHEEVVQALKVDADVMHIYLSAKEDNVELLNKELAMKDSEWARLLAEKKIIEDDLTIELESFKLALAGKEESHLSARTKLDQLTMEFEASTAENEGEINALMMEMEILKQEAGAKEEVLRGLQQSVETLTADTEASAAAAVQAEEQLRRLTDVDIPRLKRELQAKEMDFEATLHQSTTDRSRHEEENKRLREELESRKKLDATVPGKKSKFICF